MKLGYFYHNSYRYNQYLQKARDQAPNIFLRSRQLFKIKILGLGDLSKITIFWSWSLFRFFVRGFSKSDPLKFSTSSFQFLLVHFSNFARALKNIKIKPLKNQNQDIVNTLSKSSQQHFWKLNPSFISKTPSNQNKTLPLF